MSVHQVEVRVVGESLAFTPTHTTLAQGDWVWWHFSHVPAGYVPFIQFQDPQLGPFHSVRSLGNDAVIGKGNTGQSGTYTYRAILLDPDTGTTMTSGYVGEIDNQVEEADTSPEAQVVVTPNPDLSPGAPKYLVDVTPDTLCLNAGDTAIWAVSGLEPDTFITFHFEKSDDHTTSTNRTGPFAAFIGMAGGGNGELRAHATGFMTGAGSPTPPESIPARFTYWIDVWSVQGEHLGGHDPVIDNLGPPIPG